VSLAAKTLAKSLFDPSEVLNFELKSHMMYTVTRQTLGYKWPQVDRQEVAVRLYENDFSPIKHSQCVGFA